MADKFFFSGLNAPYPGTPAAGRYAAGLFEGNLASTCGEGAGHCRSWQKPAAKRFRSPQRPQVRLGEGVGAAKSSGLPGRPQRAGTGQIIGPGAKTPIGGGAGRPLDNPRLERFKHNYVLKACMTLNFIEGD